MDSNNSISNQYNEIIKECHNYDNFIDNSEENYLNTLVKIRKLVQQIQSENLFSANEDFSEIDTYNLKYLLIPFYEAETQLRIMNKRLERLQMAQLFSLEYLKLMNHYKLLDKNQKKQLKMYVDEQEGEQQQEQKLNPQEERNRNIETFKKKKQIENCIQLLEKDMDKNEAKLRELYEAKLNLSIFKCFEQLKSIKEEIKIQQYMKTRTEEDQQQQHDNQQQKKPQIIHIPKGGLQTQPQYFLCDRHQQQQEQEQPMQQNIVQDYYQQQVDSEKQTSHIFNNFERITKIDKTTADQQIQMKDQMKKQVFQPGFNMPTMSIEELAEIELKGAMQRQKQAEEKKKEEEMEDEDNDEDLRESKRQEKMRMEDWKDYVPKGRGNTSRI